MKLHGSSEPPDCLSWGLPRSWLRLGWVCWWGWQEGGGRTVLTRHSRSRSARSRKWRRTPILTRLPNVFLGLEEGCGEQGGCVQPHELSSWQSCPDPQGQNFRGTQARIEVGGFPRNISALPDRGQWSPQASHPPPEQLHGTPP